MPIKRNDKLTPEQIARLQRFRTEMRGPAPAPIASTAPIKSDPVAFRTRKSAIPDDSILESINPANLLPLSEHGVISLLARTNQILATPDPGRVARQANERIAAKTADGRYFAALETAVREGDARAAASEAKRGTFRGFPAAVPPQSDHKLPVTGLIDKANLRPPKSTQDVRLVIQDLMNQFGQGEPR